jgi:hypothetical protein
VFRAVRELVPAGRHKIDRMAARGKGVTELDVVVEKAAVRRGFDNGDPHRF